MSRATILLVEDNEDERRIFSTYLEFVGCTILSAGDGESGLALARARRPDLIFLDLGLPGIDGWEVLERLRAEPALRHVPVVALTARHLAREALEERGFCGYLEKPVAPFRVLEEVERCLGPVHRERSRRPGSGSGRHVSSVLLEPE